MIVCHLVRVTLALVLVVIVASGCAGPTYSGAESPRVRCLSDARSDTAAGTRPLFFFFCAEAP